MKRYTEEELKNAVKVSFSIAQVLTILGLKVAGGNYSTVKRKILVSGIDMSHFTGQGHLKSKTHTWAKKTPLEEILVKGSTYGGSGKKLKDKLFKDGLLEEKCYSCGLKEWMGQKLPLELEHKNGDHFDNRIENLTILCPNCHSLTSTYRGKNKKSRGVGIGETKQT